MVIQLLLLVAATLPTTAEAIGVSSSCAATNNGSTGRVGCTFSVDIDKSKHNFLIQRYDLNIGGEPDDVLACTWTYEGLTCDVKSTYQFDRKVSSKVVLEIPRLTEDHEGMYLCAVLPQSGDNENVKSCKLKVNALNSVCTADGTSGRIECTFDVDIQKTKDNFVIQRFNDRHDATPDRVLSCVWTIVGLRCEVEDTYRFDYDVSSKVVVEIPKITKAHEGVYGCYGIPVKNDQAKKCSLTIPGASEREEPKKIQTTLSTGKAVQKPCEEKLEKYILATGILSGILGTIVVLAVVYKYWDGIINCIRAGVQGNGPATQSPAEGAPGRQTDERKENPPPAVEAKSPLLPQGHTDGLADNPPSSGQDQTSKQPISLERTDEDTGFVELKKDWACSPNGSLR